MSIIYRLRNGSNIVFLSLFFNANLLRNVLIFLVVMFIFLPYFITTETSARFDCYVFSNATLDGGRLFSHFMGMDAVAALYTDYALASIVWLFPYNDM